MPIPKKKRPVGCPPKEIDYEACEKLARIMCTQSEIAEVLGVSLSTLEHDKEFLRIHKKGQENGRASLRRMQYKGAEAGNPTMLIWLGKQYLGQRDKQELTGKDGGPIEQTVELDLSEKLKKYAKLWDGGSP